MNTKRLFVMGVCSLTALGIMGCPLPGPLVIGAYKIYFDDNCDDQDDSVHTLYLYGNGTLEFVHCSEIDTGIWSVDGAAFNMTIYDFSGADDLHGNATIDANALVNGAYTIDALVDVDGCFRATKVIFDSAN